MENLSLTRKKSRIFETLKLDDQVGGGGRNILRPKHKKEVGKNI